MTNRRGRKRKSTRSRERNGRDQRVTAAETAQDAMSVALEQPHRRGLADPLDDRAESELGRLNLAGLVTRPQYRAGKRWAKIVMREHLAIDAPRGCPTGVLAGLMAGRAGGEISPEQADEARAEYDAADCAMVCGFRPLEAHAIRRAVNTIAVAGRPWPDLPRLLLGLDALAAYFESRDRAKDRIPYNMAASP